MWLVRFPCSTLCRWLRYLLECHFSFDFCIRGFADHLVSIRPFRLYLKSGTQACLEEEEGGIASSEAHGPPSNQAHSPSAYVGPDDNEFLLDRILLYIFCQGCSYKTPSLLVYSF
jgi:hypothetical protein